MSAWFIFREIFGLKIKLRNMEYILVFYGVLQYL